jgi:hypothetical protein
MPDLFSSLGVSGKDLDLSQGMIRVTSWPLPLHGD